MTYLRYINFWPCIYSGYSSWVWQKRHESRINTVEMHSLRSLTGINLIDRVRNSVIRERCVVKENIVGWDIWRE